MGHCNVEVNMMKVASWVITVSSAWPYRPTLTGVVSVLWRTHQIVVLCCPVSEDEQSCEGSEGEDRQMGFFGAEAGGEDDAGSSPIKRWRLLMEREWSRREVCIEQSFWNYFYNPVFCGEPPLNDRNTPVNSSDWLWRPGSFLSCPSLTQTCPSRTASRWGCQRKRCRSGRSPWLQHPGMGPPPTTASHLKKRIENENIYIYIYIIYT